MNKMENLKYIIGIIFFSILVVSCTDQLNKLPLDAPSSETFPSNEKQLKDALIGAKSPLHLTFGENPWPQVFDMFSDIAGNRDIAPQQMWGDPSSNYVKQIWAMLYRIISRCNYLLSNINKVSKDGNESSIKNIGAQAKFLRAYSYFILTELYGDVPYITTVQDLSNAYVPRQKRRK
jgi:hypothetical protein